MDYKKISIPTILLSALLVLSVLAACTKSSRREEPNPDPDTEIVEEVASPELVERAVLVYAINKSSLSSDFIDDSKEMLTAMSTVDSEKYRLLVYYTVNNDECGLFEARIKKGTDDFEFAKVKTYERNVTSTHPDRIAEVLEDGLGIFPNAAYDLVFWGHGTAWRPENSDHEIVTPPVQGYGGEYNPDYTKSDWTDIDELAAAVPDNRFEAIWFDCCYLSGIETIYQLRNKCRYYIGYPTEVWQYGLAYDLMLPYLTRENPDYVMAAKAFYDHYSEMKYPVTVAVMDMAHLEEVADAAREIAHCGLYGPLFTNMVNYSRMLKTPLYDLRQLFSQKAEANSRGDLADKLYAAIDKFVIYHAESDRNFNNVFWDTTQISGINTHYYKGQDTKEEAYYRTLDWYRQVYE